MLINPEENVEDIEGVSDLEDEVDEVETWLTQLSAMTLLAITSLHQLHYGKFYRNRFLQKQQVLLRKNSRKAKHPVTQNANRIKSITCEYCHKMFGHKWFYERHIVVHTREKNYKCTTCGKTFGWESALYRHNALHQGIKYTCSVCGKAYAQRGNLMLHAKKEHEERNPDNINVCDECGKEFNYRESLRLHIGNKHADPTKMTCITCGAVYSCVSTLKRHIKKFMGSCIEKENQESLRSIEKSKNCPECGKYFEKRNNLKVHVKTVHQRLKEFACHLCSSFFFTKRNVLMHIDKNHS